MAQIMYRVPYQIDILAHDVTTGKRIGNTIYVRCGNEAPPLPYGAPISGGGSTTTLLNNFATAWEVLVNAVLSTKYKLSGYTMQAIVGYGYATTVTPINALVTGPVFTLVQTATPHGLTSGDTIRLTGVTLPAAVNGVWAVVVVNPTQIQVPVATTGAWSGDGSIQRASGRLRLLYQDREEKVSTATGGVAGDALPIFTDVDVRRLNSGVGKNFRSRFAMAPIGEADNDFGKLNTTAVATWAAALAVFNAGYANGGSVSASQTSFNVAVSKQIAETLASPFVQSEDWAKVVNSMAAHTRLGSQNNRKPALSGL